MIWWSWKHPINFCRNSDCDELQLGWSVRWQSREVSTNNSMELNEQHGIDWMTVEKPWHGTYNHACWAMSGFIQHNQGRPWQRLTLHKYHPAAIAAVSQLKVGIVSSRGLDSKIKRLLLSKEKKPKFGHLRLSDTSKHDTSKLITDKFSVIQANMLIAQSSSKHDILTVLCFKHGI